MILFLLFLFSIFNMKKIFPIVSPPTFHLAPRPLLCGLDSVVEVLQNVPILVWKQEGCLYSMANVFFFLLFGIVPLPF